MSRPDPAVLLASCGAVTIETGLTDAEFVRLRTEFGFDFADDHRAFLAAGLPVGAGWPNWRDDGRRTLRAQLQLPVEGIRFAVEWRSFWPDEWGARPARTKDALRSADYHLARVPRLIPVHANRYLPAGASSGSPVLQVMQTEVRVAGVDLAGFLEAEFASRPPASAGTARTVAFWSDLSVPGSTPGP